MKTFITTTIKICPRSTNQSSIYVCVVTTRTEEQKKAFVKNTPDPGAMAASYSSKSPSMNVEAVLHMKEGLGETSYAQNSSLQVNIY
jgi:hypothetical protein